MVGVASRDELDAIEAFISNTNTSGFEHVADLDGSVWSAFGIASQPAWAFIDADGNVETVLGALGEGTVSERLDEMLS